MVATKARPKTKKKTTLEDLRVLWRADSHSTGYAHPSLVYAACKLLEPVPEAWNSKSLLLVFYTDRELETIPVECRKIIQKGFRFFQEEERRRSEIG